MDFGMSVSIREQKRPDYVQLSQKGAFAFLVEKQAWTADVPEDEDGDARK